MPEPSATYQFGQFQIDLRRRVLLRDGQHVPMTPKALDMLALLVENRGRIVLKDEMLAALWPDTVVEEGNLTVNISLVRRVLGESPHDHRYIVTVPGRGYRFVAEVRPCASQLAPVNATSDSTSPELTSRRYGRANLDRWLRVMPVRRQTLAVLAITASFALAIPRVTTRTESEIPNVPEYADARTHYLRGRYLLDRRTPEGLRRGLALFQRVVRLTPDYAPAHVGIADAYNMLGYFGVLPPREAFALGKAAALKALSLDNKLAEAYTALAYVQHRFDWDWPGAERGFRRAIALNPNYAAARHWYAAYLASMGRVDEAIEESKRAEQLDPLSLTIAANLGSMLHSARGPVYGLEQSRRVLEIDPTFWVAHSGFARAHMAANQYDQAITEYEKAADLSHRSTTVLADLGVAYAVAGRSSDARAVLAELDALSAARYVSPFDRASIHAALSENDLAFAWLERAYADRSSQLAFLKTATTLANVRSDPRFAVLVKRVGLPD